VLHQALDDWAARQPRAEFAVDGQRRLRYAEAQDVTRRLARALHQAGAQPGERIAVLAKNRLEYVELLYAAARAGLAVVPLNTRLAPQEWAFILADAEPRLVFVEAAFVEAIDALRGQLTRPARYIGLDPATARRPGWESFAAWLEQAPAEASPAPPPDPQRDVLQLYTSATTGQPKGAVLTHRAVCANIDQIQQAITIASGERSLVVAPLFHAAVLPSTLTPLAAGGCVVLQSEFRPANVVRALDTERIAFAVLVPAVLQACLSSVADVEQRTFAALRLIYYGSAPIAEPTLRAASHAFGCDFIQSYGLTEASQAVTFLDAVDHRRGLADRPDLLVSAGRAAANTELRIVDALDRDVPAGQPGEVLVRGPQLMRGYWHQPAATAEALRGGWLHTGDVGTLDSDGYVVIRDRLKDLIVSGGENVYPRAIEAVLEQHPAVLEAAVIGVPDPRWGETVMAVIVLRESDGLSAAEVIAHCRTHLGGFEVPRAVEFVPSLPRNALGKVLKRTLRAPYWSGHTRQVAGA